MEKWLLIILMVAFVSAEHYVTPTGTVPYSTCTNLIAPCSLEEAAANAGPGDTVIVTAGTYSGTISFGNSGTSGNPLIFNAEPGVILDGRFSIDKQHITIKGFTVDSDGTAISIRNDHNIIQDNTITHCGWGAIAIDIRGDYNIIENNDISGITDDFTRFFGKYNVIRNNYFHDSVDEPDSHLDAAQTYCASGDPYIVQYNLIENNYMHNVEGGNAHFAVIQDEVPSLCDMHDVIIRYNRGNNVGSGFVISDEEVDYVKVYQNTVNEHSADHDPKPWTTLGIYDGSENGAIINNILMDSTRDNAEGYTKISSTDTHNNLAYLSSCDITCSWRSPISDETGLVKNQDPLLNSDMSLQAGSPAIDAGGELTIVAASDSGSGTSLVVEDAHYFQDGWAGVQADWIAVGSASNTVQIATINYDTNTITLASAISRNGNDPVYLFRDSDGTQVLYGNYPDVGAVEYQSGSPTPVNGVCGSSVNSCSAGSLNDITDSSTQYLWQCAGLNGGTTASCSSDISTGEPEEIIIENTDSGFSTTGSWPSSGYAGAYGSGSLYSTVNEGSTARWSPGVSGTYDVYAWWTAGEGRVNDAKYTVAGQTVTVNQKANGGQWNLLGTFTFGSNDYIELSDASTDPNYIEGSISDSVCADAVKLVPGECAQMQIGELIQFMNEWKSGTRTIQQVMEAIQEWKSGC